MIMTMCLLKILEEPHKNLGGSQFLTYSPAFFVCSINNHFGSAAFPAITHTSEHL